MVMLGVFTGTMTVSPLGPDGELVVGTLPSVV
jgi:alpha-acetolactate decarboxylase